MLRLQSRLEERHVLQLDGFSPVFARLLEARGVTTAEAAQAFLHPHLSQLHDPFALSGMAEAVRILEIALQAGTPMVLYGDYDVDGVCGVSILYEYLQARGAQVAYYIPARHGEGYGLNRGAVEKLAQTARLLITVDCGMTNVEEVALAHTLGMQVIVTDHHEIPDPYPQCEAVINPLLGAYPFRRLCGAGVAWKLVCAMGGLEAAEPLLELAALATVADLVPLLDENRVLVSAGLAAMQHTTRPGLRALLAVSGLEGKMITAGHLGFQLGPRINAGGRLAHAGRSVVMMTTRDAAQAQEIAEALQAENVCRQQLEQAILRQADAWTQTNMDFQKERALVIAGKDWSAGVVGLVASRLVEKYRWPTVLLSEQGEVCVGSARSIPGVNIYQAMRACAHLFTRFGGHAQAAGVTLPTQNVPAFRVALSDAIAAQAQADTFMPLEMYDLPLTLPEVTVEWVEQLAGLQPTGFGNPAPTFCLRGAQVASFRCVGRAQAHLQLQLRQADCLLGGIAFRQGRQAETLPDCVDALFTPTLNEWNGKRIPQCEVQRLLPHAADEAFEALCAREDEAFARESLTQLHQCMDDRQACALPLETPDGLRERIAAALRAGCQGLLLIVYTRQGVRDALSWLRAEGLTDRLDYRLGMAEDVRGFHTLCALPNFAAWTTHFTDLVFLEGEPPFAEALLARAACPQARLYAQAGQPLHAQWQETVRAWAPSDEAMRTLYRAVRKGQGTFSSLASVAAASGLTTTATQAGLEILVELSLVEMRRVPFDVALLPAQRCDLMQSRLLRGIRAWASGMEESNA